MEITGRVTANATVNETKGSKKVVGFAIAINDNYRTKEGERKQITTYVNCSYWKTEAVAPYLVKGTIVELFGRIGASAWLNKEGEPKASVTFLINSIQFITGARTGTASMPANSPSQGAGIVEQKEDLPF